MKRRFIFIATLIVLSIGVMYWNIHVSAISFNGLLTYMDENPNVHDQLKMMISNYISPGEAKQLIVKIVAEASNSFSFAETLVGDIDSVNNLLAYCTD